MNPGKFDFNMYRGDSYTWRFILWSDEARLIPVDLTGATVAAEIREKDSGTIILPLPCVVELPNKIDISMTPDMYDQCPLKGVWDLQITFSDGEVQTPIGGTVTVTPDVTGSVAVVRKVV